MRRPDGYISITDPEHPKGTFECDVVQCAHCQRVVPVRPGQSASDAGGFCMQCFRGLCGPCADDGRCTPFERKLEQMEGRARFLRAVGV